MSRIAVLALGAALLLPGAAIAQHIDLPASRQDLERAAKKDSNDAAAHYNLALAYWNEKRWDDAERELHTAVTIEPQFAEAYLALSYVPYARRSDLFDEVSEDKVPAEWQDSVAQSDRDYRHAFLLDPLCDLKIAGAVLPTRQMFLGGDYEWLGDFISGLGLLRQGKYEEAYQRFERVTYAVNWDHHPERTPTELRWYRGLAAAHAGHYEAAERDFTALLDTAAAKEQSGSLIHIPLETNDYRYMLATIEQRKGDADSAIALYQTALEHDLGLYMAHVQIARLDQAARRSAEALTEYHRAVDANPGDASLLFDLGLAEAETGKLQEALTPLEQAAQLDPRDSRIPYYIGRVDEARHDTEGARAAYQRFLGLAPSRYARQIADAKQRLARLP